MEGGLLVGWLLIFLFIVIAYVYSRSINSNLGIENEEQSNLTEEINSTNITVNQIENIEEHIEENQNDYKIEVIEAPNKLNELKNMGHKVSNTIENPKQPLVSKNILLCSDCLERNGCSQVYNVKKGCDYYRCGGSYKPEYWPKEMLGPYGEKRYKNN